MCGSKTLNPPRLRNGVDALQTLLLGPVERLLCRGVGEPVRRGRPALLQHLGVPARRRVDLDHVAENVDKAAPVLPVIAVHLHQPLRELEHHAPAGVARQRLLLVLAHDDGPLAAAGGRLEVGCEAGAFLAPLAGLEGDKRIERAAVAHLQLARARVLLEPHQPRHHALLVVAEGHNREQTRLGRRAEAEAGHRHLLRHELEHVVQQRRVVRPRRHDGVVRVVDAPQVEQLLHNLHRSRVPPLPPGVRRVRRHRLGRCSVPLRVLGHRRQVLGVVHNLHGARRRRRRHRLGRGEHVRRAPRVVCRTAAVVEAHSDLPVPHRLHRAECKPRWVVDAAVPHAHPLQGRHRLRARHPLNRTAAAAAAAAGHRPPLLARRVQRSRRRRRLRAARRRPEPARRRRRLVGEDGLGAAHVGRPCGPRRRRVVVVVVVRDDVRRGCERRRRRRPRRSRGRQQRRDPRPRRGRAGLPEPDQRCGWTRAEAGGGRGGTLRGRRRGGPQLWGEAHARESLTSLTGGAVGCTGG
eukprot:Rhum_TRINITY_DN8810_c0_g1::Rhum_TRINITY_DN8810_c0_g1_i1::g.30023::m.30023